MLGSRDSELAVIVHDTEMVSKDFEIVYQWSNLWRDVFQYVVIFNNSQSKLL